MNETEARKKVEAKEIAPRSEVKIIIEAFLETIRKELKEDGEVRIKNLGVLKAVTTKPRKGRNPRTGEVIEIGERKTVKFTASPNFIRNILNGGK